MEEPNNCTRCAHFQFHEEWNDESGFTSYYCCDLHGNGQEADWGEARQNTCGSWTKQPYEVN